MSSSIVTFIFLLLTCAQTTFGATSRKLSSNVGQTISQNSIDITNSAGGSDSHKGKIAVLYDSSGIDKAFQLELLKSVFISLKEIDQDDLRLEFIDVSNVPNAANWIWSNATGTLISLLNRASLSQFTSEYDNYAKKSVLTPPLKIFTPRLIDNSKAPSSVLLFSLQMQGRALSVALLNRVEKVGIKNLIPVLDSNNQDQFHLLDEFIAAGQHRSEKIKFTRPIFIDNQAHFSTFREILDEYSGFNTDQIEKHENIGPKPQLGVLLLASKGSQLAMKLAAEKNHMQIGWFSPSILQHEEFAYNITEFGKGNETGEDPSSNHTYVNPNFGLYTVLFVGSSGWDNPSRRRVLRELTTYTGATPRILDSILAYDTASLAALSVRNKLHFPVIGLSGEIRFDSKGYRREGVFFGVSAVPDLASPSVTLLQPSTWILEDTITLIETIEGEFLIKDYEVATSSLLTGPELRALASQTRYDFGCGEHIMNLITHDPFNQMPYNYYFKEGTLPESLLIPNQHGFGITILCFHTPSTNASDDTMMTSKLQIACTPGHKISEPIRCFQSKAKVREKRSPGDIPQVQYQFGTVNDIWNHQPQNSKWTNPQTDSLNNDNYYSQHSYRGPSTIAPIYDLRLAFKSGYFFKHLCKTIPIFRRQDTSGPTTTVASTAAPPTSKLPDLRGVLKGAKPFVGSCIGSTTGCAMCVLVLGRLPLGAVPAACTGPCFVGTFGSCGALLGRVFSETTVICTELFRQGLMDPETFFADAEFGRIMAEQFPTMMEGYQLLATPLVEVMKKSPLVTNVISFFATPWAHHMKYIMGRSNQPNFPGLIVHTIGHPICNFAGYFHATFYPYFDIFFIITLLFLTLLTISNYKFKYTDDRAQSTITQFSKYIRSFIKIIT